MILANINILTYYLLTNVLNSSTRRASWIDFIVTVIHVFILSVRYYVLASLRGIYISVSQL